VQMCVPHVDDAGDARTVFAPVIDDARQRDTAEVDAVIRTLARNEHRAAALPARLVIGERGLHRRVDRFGAGIDEENVLEIAGRQLGDARGELEALRMPAQERREVQFAELPMYRFGDLLAAMARRDAKEARRRVDDLVAAVVVVVHAFGAYDDPRIGLEVAIRRERHPQLVEGNRLLRGLVAKREFGVAHGRSQKSGVRSQKAEGRGHKAAIETEWRPSPASGSSYAFLAPSRGPHKEPDRSSGLCQFARSVWPMGTMGDFCPPTSDF